MGEKIKVVYNVGINDVSCCIDENRKNLRSYTTWCSMLRRCYSDEYHKKRPTYIGCSVNEEWLRFSNFKKWYDINYIDGYALDKDILIPGNKVYSSETCIFVPAYVNCFFNFNQNTKDNTSNYTGVSWHKANNKWKVDCYDVTTNKQCYLGHYNNEIEAYQVYRDYKNSQAKVLAREFISSNPKLYEVLMNFDVETYRTK